MIGRQVFGCIPCRLVDPVNHVLATVQHVTEGYKRLGHWATYGCCTWHHFGEPPQRPGPSLAINRREYRATFGSELLLVNLQDWLIDQYRMRPWNEYELPLDVARQLHERWVKMRGDDTHFEG